MRFSEMKTLAGVAYVLKLKEHNRNKARQDEAPVQTDLRQGSTASQGGTRAEATAASAASETPQKVDKGKQRAE